jgi:hypothetical protein
MPPPNSKEKDKRKHAHPDNWKGNAMVLVQHNPYYKTLTQAKETTGPASITIRSIPPIPVWPTEKEHQLVAQAADFRHLSD